MVGSQSSLRIPIVLTFFVPEIRYLFDCVSQSSLRIPIVLTRQMESADVAPTPAVSILTEDSDRSNVIFHDDLFVRFLSQSSLRIPIVLTEVYDMEDGTLIESQSSLRIPIVLTSHRICFTSFAIVVSILTEDSDRSNLSIRRGTIRY